MLVLALLFVLNWVLAAPHVYALTNSRVMRRNPFPYVFLMMHIVFMWMLWREMLVIMS